MLAALHRRRRNGWWHFQLFSDPNSAVDGDLTVLNALVILTPSPATLAHGTGQHKILHYNFDALVDTARRRATLAIPLHNITQRWPLPAVFASLSIQEFTTTTALYSPPPLFNGLWSAGAPSARTNG